MPITATETKRSNHLWLMLWFGSMAALTIGSLLPGDSAALRYLSATHISDKLIHGIGYMVAAVFPAMGLEGWKVWASTSALVLLGVALEFAQRLVPGRSFELADMSADLAGALAGTAVGLFLRSPRS